MEICITGHHSGTHGRSQSVFCCGFGIYPPDFGMVGKSQVIIQAPNQVFLAAELHPRTDFSFQLREEKVAVKFLGVLSQRSSVLLYLLENIHEKVSVLIKE